MWFPPEPLAQPGLWTHFFPQVLLLPSGDIPPSPPGLQKQLETVASFSIFKELLQVSSWGEHCCGCQNCVLSKCPPYLVLGDQNLDCLVRQGRSPVSYHSWGIFLESSFEQPESYILSWTSIPLACYYSGGQPVYCRRCHACTGQRNLEDKEDLFITEKLHLCQPRRRSKQLDVCDWIEVVYPIFKHFF